MPFQTLLETTGRVSGLPRTTPVGGRRAGDAFWLVSEFGERSQYVRNIKADPRVRVRIRGRWHTGTAHLMPEDDPVARLRTLPASTAPPSGPSGPNCSPYGWIWTDEVAHVWSPWRPAAPRVIGVSHG